MDQRIAAVRGVKGEVGLVVIQGEHHAFPEEVSSPEQGPPRKGRRYVPNLKGAKRSSGEHGESDGVFRRIVAFDFVGCEIKFRVNLLNPQVRRVSADGTSLVHFPHRNGSAILVPVNVHKMPFGAIATRRGRVLDGEAGIVRR